MHTTWIEKLSPLLLLDIAGNQEKVHTTSPKQFINNNWRRHYRFYGYRGSSGGVVYTRWGRTTCPLPLEQGCCMQGMLVGVFTPIVVVGLTTFACLNNLSI